CERVLTREQAIRERDLAAPRHAELLAEDVAVCLCRSRGDPELRAQLLVRKTLRDQLDHTALPLGDRRRIPECLHDSTLTRAAAREHSPNGVFRSGESARLHCPARCSRLSPTSSAARSATCARRAGSTTRPSPARCGRSGSPCSRPMSTSASYATSSRGCASVRSARRC